MSSPPSPVLQFTSGFQITGGDSSSSMPAKEDDHHLTTVDHPHSRSPTLPTPSLGITNEQNPEKASLVQDRKNIKRMSGSSEDIDCAEGLTVKDDPAALIRDDDSEKCGTSEEIEAHETPQPRRPGTIDNIERSLEGEFSNLFSLNERTSNPPAHLFLAPPRSGSPDDVLSPLYSDFCPSTLTPTGISIPSRTTYNVNNGLLPEFNAPIGNGIAQKHDHDLLNRREQSIQFHAVMSRISDSGNFGPFLPQVMYKPYTTSDRKRYVEEVLLEPPIYFKFEHHEGILLKDALHSRTKKLLDRDGVVFEGRGPSVSIRLEWPGYRPWSRQIPTKDFRSPPQPITLAKLAQNIAKCVQRFMQDRKTQLMEHESDQRWKIGDGPNDIKLDDLMLVSIHHVSLGSWQPHLRLVHPPLLPAPTTPWLESRL